MSIYISREADIVDPDQTAPTASNISVDDKETYIL